MPIATYSIRQCRTSPVARTAGDVYYPPARGPNSGGGVIRRGHEPVRLIPVLGRQDDLGVAARQRQAGLADVIVTPPQLVAEGITVEAQARVKIWHRDGDRVDHLEQGSR